MIKKTKCVDHVNQQTEAHMMCAIDKIKAVGYIPKKLAKIIPHNAEYAPPLSLVVKI